MSESLIAIQNPGEEPQVFQPCYLIDGSEIISCYGEKIKYGAFVTVIDLNEAGEVDGDGEAELYIADRVGEDVYLQANERLADGDDVEISIDNIGGVVFAGTKELESLEEPPAPPEPDAVLGTFTAFGRNDDGEKFVVIFAADANDRAVIREAAINAALVDEGCEDMVTVAMIVRGDQTAIALEDVTI